MCEGRRARGEAGRGNGARRPDFSAFEDPDNRRDTRDGHEAGGDPVDGRPDAFHRRNPVVVVACDSCFNAFGSGNHDDFGSRRTAPVNVTSSDDRTDNPVDVVGSGRHAGVRVFP